ncbi:MAG: hypothetical protein P4M11_13875 [Candidatus Pacebacteria bacterium]|nr:hypothetical protein [Candidatus Paceibacterota bacterium]
MTGTQHAPDNCKEVGLALMHQCIQDAGSRLVNGLAKGMRKCLKKLEAGLQQEIDRFQSNYVQTEELRKMQKLASEGRYAELYSHAKSLFVSGTKKDAAMSKLNKRLIEINDTASAGLKKVLSKFAAAAQYKPVLAAYKKDEIFVIKDASYDKEEQIVSALESSDM